VSIPIANPQISEAAKEAVCDVLDSGMLADGEVVREFESEFAEYVGTEHAVATTNGTTALQVMLEAAGIGEGDVVLTTPFSFIASANAIVHAGAEPVFADIDPETFNLDPEKARDVIKSRGDVDAIMPVHLYGLPADMGAFQNLADEHDLLLFEDAAQAHGAEYEGDRVGSVGDAASFSFYPTKNMTTGEGGMVTTDDDDIAERLRRLVNHGRTDTYEHAMVGYNFRMTNIQAAIGREQLERLPGWIEQRRENAFKLTEGLKDISNVRTPRVDEDRTHVFHQYTIRVNDRSAIKKELNDKTVGYGVYYPKTIPSQPPYDKGFTVPVSQTLSEKVLSVPVHPIVDNEAIDTIVSAVTQGTSDDR
jgi:perosamine synthetase